MNIPVQECLSARSEFARTPAPRDKRKRFRVQNLKRNPVRLTENRGITERDVPQAESTGTGRVDAAAQPLSRTTVKRPIETCGLELRSPYIIELEVNCDDCGGSGFDPGGIDPWGPEVCPTCHGTRTQRITRNYLAEAFQIAANPDSIRVVERQHLIAVIQHCREAVSALMSLPEVA